MILIENMVLRYKNGNALPSSDVIAKVSPEVVLFSEYPIEATSISIYIPEGESRGAAATVQTTSYITKPVTAVLMIVAMPAALVLEKTV